MFACSVVEQAVTPDDQQRVRDFNRTFTRMFSAIHEPVAAARAVLHLIAELPGNEELCSARVFM